MTEQEILAAILAGEQSIPVIVGLINKFRGANNLPPLTAQEQHDKNTAALDEIDAANKA